MARADLRGLIGNLGEVHDGFAGAVREPDDVPSHASSTRRLPEKTPTTSVHVDPPLEPSRPIIQAPDNPRFLDFERKETRLRSDQQNALTEHARRLNRSKGTGGARITDNTLIRVAVDLLLAKADKLAGQNEAELRHSVGLKGADR
jgi:hypothetical protein